MGVSVRTDIIATAESKRMAAMAFANFAQKQELENKQFAADENKTVNRKWSCDEDGVHISTQWLPIPRVRTFSLWLGLRWGRVRRWEERVAITTVIFHLYSCQHPIPILVFHLYYQHTIPILVLVLTL